MKTVKTIITGIACVIAMQTGYAQANHEWRPDDRTGVSSETGLLKEWPESGPELIWSNTELSRGFSSVSFNDESIFLTANDGDMDVVIALDLQGNIQWKSPIGRAWTDSYPDSRCTPTVDGNRVYASSGMGDLACLNAGSGQVIWTLEASKTYKGTFGPWGIAESLIIDGEKLYFTPGGAETMTMALDKSTGALIWKSPSLNDQPGYVSPILIDYASRRFLVNVSGNHVYAVDVSDGSLAWKIRHMDISSEKSREVWPDAPLIKCVTPLYHEGMIFITGGYDHGGIMLDLSEEGDAVEVAWTSPVLDVHHGGVVLMDGYLYGSNWIDNSNGNWCCLEWETGKRMYEEEWYCKGSIIAADGLLYVYDEKRGNVGLVNPAPERFDLISSFRIREGSGPHWAHPVIHQGRLYIRHGNALMAYDISMS